MESGYALNVHNRYLLAKLEHELIKKVTDIMHASKSNTWGENYNNKKL